MTEPGDRSTCLHPKLAIARTGAEIVEIPPDLARRLIDADEGVAREWRKWRAIGGGRGTVVLLRPDLLERFAGELPTPAKRKQP